MKINWGTGIAIFYSFFVLVLVFAVYKSTLRDNSLVSNQYYKDDINYQQHYVRLVNSQALAEDVSIRLLSKEKQVQLQFPNLKNIKGDIHFFSPSFSQGDFKTKIQLNADNQQIIKINQLKRGLWRVKVNWESEEKAFYKEGSNSAIRRIELIINLCFGQLLH